MGRVETREMLFKLVFEYALIKEKNETIMDDVLEQDKLDKDYLVKAYDTIVNEFDALTEEIAQNTKGYNKDRIFKIDLALLVVALYEIKNVDSIPVAVSINEALNLAKKYSTEKSAGFINGVLANIVNK